MKTWLMGVFGVCVVVILATGSANAVPVYADTVNSFTGGNNFGVFDQSSGSYTGSAGAGVYDPLAVTDLDGASLGLGGQSGTPGEIVVSFSSGVVIDAPGADIRVYDTFGLSEGLTLEASADGLVFSTVGTFGGSGSTTCTPGLPCATDFNLGDSGLSLAQFFRVTVVQGRLGQGGGCMSGYPECYDLDALEALNFSAVPLPPALYFFASGILGLIGIAKRRRI